MRSPLNISLGDSKGLLICFSAGLILRLVPELLAFPHPISWDMVHYAYFMRGGFHILLVGIWFIMRTL